MSVTAIVVSKGRLHHLRQTLPHLVGLSLDEIILVDADCPDGSGGWVQENFSSIKVVRHRGGDTFNLSASRNTGAAAASSNWLFFVDADIQVDWDLRNWALTNVRRGSFYLAGPEQAEEPTGTVGTVLLERAAFEEIGGYDEVIVGYGGEDDDLYNRLRINGFTPRHFPEKYISAIRHGNEERTKFYPSRDLDRQRTENAAYAQLKSIVMSALEARKELSLEQRRQIMSAAQAATQSKSPLKITLSPPTRSITRLRRLDLQIDISFRVR